MRIVTTTQSGDLAGPTLDDLETRVDAIAWEMVARFQGQVPGWSQHRAPGFMEAAHEHCVDHVRAFLTVAREQRTLSADELGFVVTQAELRARQGVPLEDLLVVYRLGNRTLFHTVLEAAAASPEGTVVALLLMDRALPHTDMVTALLTSSYLRERRRQAAHPDARPVIEADLAAGGPLSAVVSALAAADLDAALAAERLGLEAAGIEDRLDMLHRATGLDPRRPGGLAELLAAVRLLDGGHEEIGR